MVPITGKASSGLSQRLSGGSSHARPPGIALTTKQASQACHVGATTLERLAGQRDFPSAYMDADDGAWRIPVADLEAAVTAPTSPVPSSGDCSHRLRVLFAVDAALKWFPSFTSGLDVA